MSKDNYSQLHYWMKVGFSLTLFQLILFTVVLAHTGWSQVKSLNETFVTLKVQNAALNDVLAEIEMQTDYKFGYDTHIPRDAPLITVDFPRGSVKVVLTEIARQSHVAFRRVNNYIDVKLNPAQPKVEEITLAIKITGTVTDEHSDPLPGATVLEKGTTNGTITDTAGQYELEVEEGAVLVFSFVGYKQREVSVNTEQHINVSLQADLTNLDEVVVIGYGTQKKSDITGAVGTVEVDELNQGVVSSLNQLLIGKSAGVNVVQNSGEPGAGFSLNIRGAGSINASNDPLYVIDGVPISNERTIIGSGIPGLANPRASRSPLASLNPEDIKSIEVLKDASATAIYGSRGSNGVVLITTKEGQSGKLQVNYHGYLGVQNIANKLDLLNADEYKRVLNAIIDEGGENAEYTVGDISNPTDWQDEISKSNALVQSHQLSFSGGTNNTTYYISLNYMNQEGLIVNSGFDRYSARVNVKSQISDKFDIGLNLTTSYSKDNFATQGAGINENAGALYAAYNYDPTLPVRNPDGSYATSPLITIDNPVALANGVNSNSNSNRIFGSVYGTYHLTDNLNLQLNIGGDFVNESRKSFISNLTKLGNDNNGIGTFQGEQRSNYLVEGTIHYSRSFGESEIDALAGITYQRFVTESAFESASNFPSDALGADNLGLGDQSTYALTTSKFGHRLGSYIGRLNYSFQEKYLFTGTVRIDGSSRFGQNNRFAVFPSVAFGWKLKEENFLKNMDAISSLKLRVSWGQTGNQGIGDYPSISTYQQGQVAIWDNNPVTTTTPSRLPNPDLKWETTEQLNVGLDFGFITERVTVSLDYYRKKTRDMLLNLPVPQSTGFNSKLTNIGAMKNTGVELSVNSINISKNNFTWSSNVNLSTIHNEVTDLGSLPQIIVGGGTFFSGDPAIIRPGTPLNSFYGYEIEGVWQTDDDFSATSDNVQAGDLKFRDQNGDGKVDTEDRVVLGNSFPDLSFSLANTFSYKHLELFISVNAVQGISMLNINKIETYYPVNFRRNKFAEPFLNRWTPENTSNKYPSFVHPFDQASKPINSYTVEDASYIKINSIRLSYTLPNVLNAIRSAVIYVTGENLITITGYDGVDPAVNPQGNANYLIDFNTYPTARTFLLGLKLGL